MAIVAITGTTLVALKYNNSHHNETESNFDNAISYNDSNEIDSDTNYQISPKFHYKNANQNELSISSHDKPIVKRSSDETSVPPEYNITDRNPSMIDEEKREKVKEVAFLLRKCVFKQ